MLKGSNDIMIKELTVLDDLRQELHCQQEKIVALEAAARYISPAGDGVSERRHSNRVDRMAAHIADERQAQLEREA